jgi:hypothetical protein
VPYLLYLRESFFVAVKRHIEAFQDEERTLEDINQPE